MLRTAQMLSDGFQTPARDSPVNASFDVAIRVKATPSSLDSPLGEEDSNHRFVKRLAAVETAESTCRGNPTP